MQNENEFSKSIAETNLLLIQAQKDYQFCVDKIKECDRLTQDYLHDLELAGLNYGGRAKKATKLSRCRQERRRYKDYADSLRPLVELLESEEGKQFGNLLKEVLGKTRKVERLRETRFYIRKEDSDLETVSYKNRTMKPNKA